MEIELDGDQRRARRAAEDPPRGPGGRRLRGRSRRRDSSPRPQRKLESKGLDMIVANDIADPSIGFEVDGNQVTMITQGDEPEHPPRGTKHEIARAITDRIEAPLRSQQRSTAQARV